jgi:hypothetical protein
MKFPLFLSIAVLAAFAGCTSICKKMDDKWKPRVGAFTYQQAMDELGPPSGKDVTGGNVTAVWRWTHTGSFNSGAYGGTIVVHHNRRLLLKFGSGNVLESYRFDRNWKP